MQLVRFAKSGPWTDFAELIFVSSGGVVQNHTKLPM